jgi:hypothetical protein
MRTSQSQLNRYAKQSEVRVRSGPLLIGVLALVAIIGAAFQAWALVKLSSIGIAMFAAITLGEYVNARRKRLRARVGHTEAPLTNRWSGRVKDKVPSSYTGVRAAQLNR